MRADDAIGLSVLFCNDRNSRLGSSQKSQGYGSCDTLRTMSCGVRRDVGLCMFVFVGGLVRGLLVSHVHQCPPPSE